MTNNFIYTPFQRFVHTHKDEMGSYGHYVNDVSIFDSKGNLICNKSNLVDFLQSPISKLVNVKQIEDLLKDINDELHL